MKMLLPFVLLTSATVTLPARADITATSDQVQNQMLTSKVVKVSVPADTRPRILLAGPGDSGVTEPPPTGGGNGK